MISLVSQFTLNLLMVGGIIFFHLLTIQLVVGYLRKQKSAYRRVVWTGRIIGLFLLDLPLIYLLILYKNWHPLWADQIMELIWVPWILLQMNVALLGIIVIAQRWIYTPLKQHYGKKNDKTVSQLSESRKEGYNPLVIPRRQFLHSTGLALGGLAANATILGAVNSDEDRIVERVKIRMPNLPEELKGTTIGMISDVHSSLFMGRERMEEYAATLQKLNADIIVLPGDFVNSRSREVYPFAEAFSRLSAPYGVYGVTGNHDYYTREIDLVAKEIEDAGITLLRNENVQIEKDGVTLRLLGVDDDAIYHVRDYLKEGKTEKSTIENLVKGIGESEPTIFLCHKPYPFEEYAELGVDLMLSGHTHGGQIVLAQLDKLNISVASLASTYISGLYKAHTNHDAQMYISRGIGTVGIPLRVNCPPEITHIMLV